MQYVNSLPLTMGDILSQDCTCMYYMYVYHLVNRIDSTLLRIQKNRFRIFQNIRNCTKIYLQLIINTSVNIFSFREDFTISFIQLSGMMTCINLKCVRNLDISSTLIYKLVGVGHQHLTEPFMASTQGWYYFDGYSKCFIE